MKVYTGGDEKPLLAACSQTSHPFRSIAIQCAGNYAEGKCERLETDKSINLIEISMNGRKERRARGNAGGREKEVGDGIQVAGACSISMNHRRALFGRHA